MEFKLNQNPKHIAIIMDGNGRWAIQRGKPRVFGHKQGVHAAVEVVEEARNLGIPNLTMFAFSKDNWKRPKMEVDILMSLIVDSLEREFQRIIDSKVKIQTIGNLADLPSSAQRKIGDITERTKYYTGMNLTLALSYESRGEILDATRKIAKAVKQNLIHEDDIDQNLFNEYLNTKGLPYVDLLIRTSGEQRLSNFLLWQSAYAELFFDRIMWPDFKKEDLRRAITVFQKRERRFGKTSEQTTYQETISIS